MSSYLGVYSVRNFRTWVCILGLLSVAASAPAPAQELVVSAAASLTHAFREIGKAFEAAKPGATVAFNFAASDVLLTQIAKGAPVDVFASADQDAMNRGEKEQLLLAGSRRNFASNQLVLVVPSKAAPVGELSALAAPRFRRIAMGSPQTVPAGRYAREVLERANLWTTLSPKLVFAQNVRQALDYVARGEAEAGFVYATDAAIMPETVRIALDLATLTPVQYPIAIVAASRQAALSMEFVRFVAAAPGQRILARHGFRAA
jgi:molybdate transport system substrate-binding protein